MRWTASPGGTGEDIESIDFPTRMQIVAELGVRAYATKHASWLSWELPLPAGAESRHSAVGGAELLESTRAAPRTGA